MRTENRFLFTGESTATDGNHTPGCGAGPEREEDGDGERAGETEGGRKTGPITRENDERSRRAGGAAAASDSAGDRRVSRQMNDRRRSRLSGRRTPIASPLTATATTKLSPDVVVGMATASAARRTAVVVVESPDIFGLEFIRGSSVTFRFGCYPPAWHSEARWMFPAASVCLFVSLSVCQHDNFRTI